MIQEKKRKQAFRKPKSYKSKTKKVRPEKPDDGLVRLNKFIANAGLCSRREADGYIKHGLVYVNGKMVTELGTKVKPDDVVKVNDRIIKQERKVYVLLNKPKDYITTVRDNYATKTVMDLVAKACKERIYPVGRLDRNTTGVLLLTNDGDLAKKLTHPKHNKKKIYHVFLDKALSKSDMDLILNGIELDDGFINADAISYVDIPARVPLAGRNDKKQIGLEIHSGRNRIVRRIFEQLGYRIKKLDRVYFAGLTKKGLQRGQWRFLTEKEVGMLKMNAYE